MQIVLSPDVIGAEIRDVDLAQPLSDADFRQIEAAFNRHAVICFPGQRWSEPQMIAFARRFGEVEKIFLTHYAHPQYPEIMYVSNIQENGRDIGHADAGRVWHTDMSYTARPPRATMLYALEIPVDPVDSGKVLGDTLFSSAADAYDALPQALQKRIAGLRAIHQVAGRRARTGTGQHDQALRKAQPAVVHPVVRTHPVTGERSLYLCEWGQMDWFEGPFVGLEPGPHGAGAALLDEIMAHLTERRFCYAHEWTEGDLLIWDNRCLNHARNDFPAEEIRLMRRVTVSEPA